MFARPSVASLLGILVSLAWPATEAQADARTRARKAFEEGQKRLDEGDYDGAIRAFEIANAIVPHPDVQYNLASACLDAGRFEEALHWYEIYLAQPTPPPDEAEIKATIVKLKALVLGRRAPSPDPDEPANPSTAPPAGEDKAGTKDAERLRDLAQAIRPISEARAKELEQIAARVEARAKAKPAPEVPASPVPSPSPTPSPAPRPPEAERPAVRPVEQYEEREVVVAATRRAERPKDAPAVVFVLTQEEIRRRGYRSVAQALRAVAGLHVVDDGVFVDVGIRGIGGGLRGMSRIIKVLIDGQPVSFRPTSGNLLGLEMIPIRAIDRIELIRGPASALYGANAFLGVLAIFTRNGGDVRGGSLALEGGLATETHDASGAPAPYPSVSGEAVVGTASGPLSVFLAMSASGLDRSGMALPTTSPLFRDLSSTRGLFSVHDTASPISLFGSVRYDLKSAGLISLEGGFQRLHSRAEWLDPGALSHYSRIVLENLWAHLGWDVKISRNAGLELFGSYGEGAPGAGWRLRPTRTGAVEPDASRHLVDHFGSQAIAGGFQLRLDPFEGFGVRVGADLDVDRESLGGVTTVFDAAIGARRPGDAILVAGVTPQDHTITNLGGFLQLSLAPAGFLDLIGGFRFDYHSVYGASLSGRFGSVFRLGDAFYLKALYGSSFRAPAPDQLYASAAFLGDAVGCLAYAPCARAGLKPQTAHTGELVLGVDLDEALEAQLTGYLSFVNDLILSFPTAGGFFVTSNAGSYLTRGLELELNVRPRLDSTLFALRAQLYVSLEATTADIPASQFDPPESIRDEFRAASLFPGASGGVSADIALLPAKLGLYVEGRLVGPRRASASNIALSASAYELPAHFVLDLNLSTRDLVLFGDRETTLSLLVENAFGATVVEGGFRGFDVPGPGRTVALRLIQEL